MSLFAGCNDVDLVKHQKQNRIVTKWTSGAINLKGECLKCSLSAAYLNM